MYIIILLSNLSMVYHVSLFRWVVENQVGKKDLVIDECDAKQSVYVFGCKDSFLQIQGNFLLLMRWNIFFLYI